MTGAGVGAAVVVGGGVAGALVADRVVFPMLFLSKNCLDVCFSLGKMIGASADCVFDEIDFVWGCVRDPGC